MSDASARAHFRAHARTSVRLQGSITHEDDGWEQSVTVVDLGLGGACVILQGPADIGDRVGLSIVAPARGAPITLPARIAWAGPSTVDGVRLGLAFDLREPGELLTLLGVLDMMVFT